MILVTGATGANGRELLKLLAVTRLPVRAMVRSPDKVGDAVPAGVELVQGDFDDRESLKRALEDVDRAFLLTPSSARAEEQQLSFVEAAKGAGICHVVKLSQFAADSTSPVRFLRYHAAVEAAIRDSDIAWTFLRPNLYMQGFLAFAGMIARDGILPAPAGDARVSVVDVRDNAAAAAAALTGSGHEGQIYTLTGPEALSHAEIAEKIGAVTGRQVTYIDVPPEQMRAALDGSGMDPWQADGLIEDYAHYWRGEAAGIDDGVERATGKPARAFESFARDYASTFGKA